MSIHPSGEKHHHVLGLSLALALLSTLYIAFRLTIWGPLIRFWKPDLFFFAFLFAVFIINIVILVRQISRKSPVEEESDLPGISSKRYQASIALTGFILFVIFFWITYQSELKNLKKVFDRRADLMKVSLQSRINELWGGVDGVRNFLENSEYVT